MAYKRKTRDVWHIEVNYGYGHGWEHECTESNTKEARERVKEYRQNTPYPVRMRLKREPIENLAD